MFVTEPQRDQALAMYPEFTEKLLWGGKVVGVRVSLASASPVAVKELVRQAWEAKAPKALSDRLRSYSECRRLIWKSHILMDRRLRQYERI